MRGNSAAFPPQYAVEGSSSVECFTSAAAERPLQGGQAPGFPCQSYPLFCSTISASSLPPSWQSEQQRRTSENWNILLVFWKMAANFSGKFWWYKKKKNARTLFPTKSSPAMSRSLPRHTHSWSVVERTQFCFLQPLLYYIRYHIFSFFCSSLNQSFKTLEDLSFFSERHGTQPISIG